MYGTGGFSAISRELAGYRTMLIDIDARQNMPLRRDISDDIDLIRLREHNARLSYITDYVNVQADRLGIACNILSLQSRLNVGKPENSLEMESLRLDKRYASLLHGNITSLCLSFNDSIACENNHDLHADAMVMNRGMREARRLYREFTRTGADFYLPETDDTLGELAGLRLAYARSSSVMIKKTLLRADDALSNASALGVAIYKDRHADAAQTELYISSTVSRAKSLLRDLPAQIAGVERYLGAVFEMGDIDSNPAKFRAVRDVPAPLKLNI